MRSNTLSILHISDLHWSEAKASDIVIVRDALISDIKAMRNDNHLLDICIFTGDLVVGGQDRALFDKALKEFLLPVLDAASVPLSRLFIVAGNHDIDRAVVRSEDYVDRGLRAKLGDVYTVNEFIDKTRSSGALSPAISRMANFLDFTKGLLSGDEIRADMFLKTRKIEINNLTIGVACFNSSWRATGEAGGVDQRQLLIGERNLDLAIEDLLGCDIKLALAHHPGDWLLEFDELAVLGRLFAEFDIIFNGHVHRNYPASAVTPNGQAIISQTGCV